MRAIQLARELPSSVAESTQLHEANLRVKMCVHLNRYREARGCGRGQTRAQLADWLANKLAF